MNTQDRTSHGKQRGARMLVVVAVALASLIDVRAQTADENATRATDGAELFRAYCASCHGIDATGNGPVASVLRHVPPDLTQLSTRNGGMFPNSRVRRIIDGRDVESHGDRDMPVWGDPFRKGADRSDRMVRDRIDAIVQFLATIQRHQAQ